MFSISTAPSFFVSAWTCFTSSAKTGKHIESSYQSVALLFRTGEHRYLHGAPISPVRCRTQQTDVTRVFVVAVKTKVRFKPSTSSKDLGLSSFLTVASPSHSWLHAGQLNVPPYDLGTEAGACESLMFATCTLDTDFVREVCCTSVQKQEKRDQPFPYQWRAVVMEHIIFPSLRWMGENDFSKFSFHRTRQSFLRSISNHQGQTTDSFGSENSSDNILLYLGTHNTS